MATLTLVVTYSGTLGATDQEVTSLTSAGTAFASLTGAELENTRSILLQSAKVINGTYGSKMNAGQG